MMRDVIFLPLAIAAMLTLVVLGRPGEGERAGGAPDVSSIYGRIQFVTSFPDYKVKVVNSFPDLKVQMVDAFPDRPGRWQKVNSFPDYKIQLVDAFPDFTIQWVDSFPGPAR
jgi:hypothetical protein